MKIQSYRFGWIIFLVGSLLVISACGLVDRAVEVANQAEKAAGTVQAAATSVQGVVTQVEGIATQAGESGLLKTASAFATQAEESGLKGTLEVLATQVPDAAGNLQETVMAVVTEGAYGEPPEDIPAAPGEHSLIVESKDILSYHTTLSFEEVVTFYKDEMPVFGWTFENEWLQAENTSVSQYTKETRKATVTISVNPVDNKTVVFVAITQE